MPLKVVREHNMKQKVLIAWEMHHPPTKNINGQIRCLGEGWRIKTVETQVKILHFDRESGLDPHCLYVITVVVERD